MSRTVAVVMATFNGERYLPAQLDSFAKQSLLPDVLIASDDGSTDRTVAVLERFARDAPFQVVIRRNERQLGYGANFLSACELADTDLIAFSDQDDIWLPEKLRCSVEPFAREHTVLCVHSATLIDAEGKVLGPYPQHITASRIAPPLSLDPWGFFSGFTMTVRRSLLQLVPSAERGADMNQRGRLTAHDRWVYFLASCVGDTAMLANPLALYRQHGNNLFGKGHSSARWWLAALSEQKGMAARSEHYCEVAAHRAALLHAAARQNPAQAAVLHRAARHWSRVAHSEHQRVSLYRAGSLGGRLQQLVQNIGDGTYRTATDGAWRRRAVARDLLGAILPPAP